MRAPQRARAGWVGVVPAGDAGSRTRWVRGHHGRRTFLRGTPVIRALHRLLRLLLPADFRARYGSGMEDVFAEAHERAGAHGVRAVLALWLREVADLAVTGAGLRRERRQRENRQGMRGRGGRPVPRPQSPGRLDGAPETRSRTAPSGGALRAVADDVRGAFRVLVRRPSTTAFAAVTVALGVGSTTAIFGTLEGVVLHPLPYDGADRMAMLWRKLEDQGLRTSPTREQVQALSAQTDLLEATAPWGVSYMTLTGVGRARPLKLGLVRPSFHEMVGRPPLLGRTFSAEELAGEGARVVLLGHGLWRDSFGGDPDVIGRALTLDGEPWTIIGVMPPRTVLPAWGVEQVDAWGPLSEEGIASASVVALLRPGVTPDMLNQRLAAAAPGADDIWDDQWHAEVSLMRDLIRTSLVDTITVLMAAVALLLVIACVNVSNLLLSSASARRRETAVRSALGAGRFRLVRQFLTESVLIALLGGLAGVALAYGGQRLMIALRPESLSALDTVELNARVLAFALGLTAASGVAFGLVPALRASRPAALEPLRTGARGGVDPVAGRFRWGLVSVQVALSFSLLVGALLVLDTLGRLSQSDAGFEADRVLVLDLELPDWKVARSEERAALYDGLAERLRTLPGVERVTDGGGAPSRVGARFGPMWAEGEERTDDTFMVYGPAVAAGYFQTIGQRVLAGRGFTEEEVRLHQDVIVTRPVSGPAILRRGRPRGSEAPYRPERHAVHRRRRGGRRGHDGPPGGRDAAPGLLAGLPRGDPRS